MGDAEPTYAELLTRTDVPAGSSWGVWPGREVLGCLNRITPERRTRAAQLVQTGEVYALDLDPEVPDPPLFERARLQREVTWLGGDIGHDELLSNYNTQASTQWDGFRHIQSREHGFYGGIADEEHGVHHWVDHGIVTRGVLADVARHREVDPATGVISADDIAGCLAAQGVAIERGDILLIRTGWMAWYQSLDAAGRDAAAGTHQGCGLRAGPTMTGYLWDLGIAAVAADNPALEAFPPGSGGEEVDDREQRFMHFQLLPRLGLPIGELFDLEALADACAADRRYDFMLTSAPLRLRNGVASPPNALAIK